MKNEKLTPSEKFLSQTKEYLNELRELRAEGRDRIESLSLAKRSMQVKYKKEPEKLKDILAENDALTKKAQLVQSKNLDKETKVCAEINKHIAENYKAYYEEVKTSATKRKAIAKQTYQDTLKEIEVKNAEAIKEISSSEKNEEHLKVKLNIEKSHHKQALYEAKKVYKETLTKIKTDVHNAYLYKDNVLTEVANGKRPIGRSISNYFENWVYQFDLAKFLFKNGLYIIILIFMIVCIAMKPNLISTGSILLILKNFSTKVFFALGVAGLILLAGTDLSIGRMVTVSTMFTCMILNPSTTVEFFGISLAGIYGSVGFVGAAIIAFLLSILVCVGFSAIAGFFSAKFKIHPFISTLGTSLVMWGLISYGTNNIKTGTITDEASNIAIVINGFPITLVYAIIAIIACWFIWNKTKFGKNMYAVGGNPEAASVSGISVFKVTMGVFILAGVLYGIGGFLQGIVTGSSSSSLGQGWELEAIAACVIGGISFTGGIGKISGAVFGCLLFEVLKYYLRGITGGSADISNIFIGIILLIAVTFDSIKYLKKK